MERSTFWLARHAVSANLYLHRNFEEARHAETGAAGSQAALSVAQERLIMADP